MHLPLGDRHVGYTLYIRSLKAKGGEGERDFAHPWAAVKIISRTPYYHAPKYYHAHDHEGGGVRNNFGKSIFSAPGTLVDPPLAPTVRSPGSPLASPSDH